MTGSWARGMKQTLPELSEGTHPTDSWISGSQPPELWRVTSCIQASQFVILDYGSRRKQLQLTHRVKTVPCPPSSQDKTEPSLGGLHSQQRASPPSHDKNFLDTLWSWRLCQKQMPSLFSSPTFNSYPLLLQKHHPSWVTQGQHLGVIFAFSFAPNLISWVLSPLPFPCLSSLSLSSFSFPMLPPPAAPIISC